MPPSSAAETRFFASEPTSAMPDFTKYVLTPAGLGDASLAIAASRAGAVGVYNAELDIDPRVTWAAMGRLAQHAHGAYGIKLDVIDEACGNALRTQASCGMAWLLVDAALIDELNDRKIASFVIGRLCLLDAYFSHCFIPILVIKYI